MTDSESGKSQPSAAELPTKEELASLPYQAICAFVGRYSRRIQLLFKYFGPDAPKECMDVVDRVSTLTQTLEVSRVSMSGLAAHVDVAVDATNNAANTAFAVFTAAANANAAFDAAAAHAPFDAAAPFNADIVIAFAAAARHDFDLLKAAVQRENWNDQTPVPSDFFGSFWPYGEPEGWPIKNESDARG